MKIMRAEYIRNKLHYFGENYEFTLIDEKYHNYATLIIKPQHIKFVKNPNKITKTQAIEEWFAAENEITREQNNAKRRKKNNET